MTDRSLNDRRTHIILLVSIVVVLAPTWADMALAWSGPGHQQTALVAWEQLDAATRGKIVALLKKHERFKEDFTAKMPPGVKDAEDSDKDRWIFMHAAIWPDIPRERGFPQEAKKKYHHGSWHYVNEPIFLSDKEKEAIGGREKVDTNLQTEWKSGMQSRKMNIMQALAKCTDRLSKDTTSGTDKALYLCWLFHLVGDLHQPIHATGLFTTKRFVKGDRGGNLIVLDKGGNLHSYWDRLPGGKKKYETLTNNVKKLLNDDKMLAAGRAAAKQLAFTTWRDESHALATELAYDKAILSAVAAKEGVEDGEEKVEGVKVPSGYRKKARKAASKRVVQAGFRLAAVLTKLVKKPSPE